MASEAESKKEHCRGGGCHKWGPPSEEERQRREGEFKQAFLEEYRKRYGDSLITADQTWELFTAMKEQWRAKKMERHGEHRSPSNRDKSPRDRSHSPGQFGERRKQMFEELHTDFQKDYATAHGNDKINAEQAWTLIQQVKQKKREKWESEWQKHGPGGGGPHGPGRGGHHGHGRHHGHGHGHGGSRSPPKDD